MADEGHEAQLLAEVAEALRVALVTPSSTPAARSFVEAVQAILTVRTYTYPLSLQRYPLMIPWSRVDIGGEICCRCGHKYH